MQADGRWVLWVVGGVAAWVAGVALQMQSARIVWWPHWAGVASSLGAGEAGDAGSISGVVTGVIAGLVAGLIGGLAVLFAKALTRGRTVGIAALGALLCASIGHQTTTWRTAQRLADRLPHALEGRVLMLEGIVGELPHRQPHGVQFVFVVERARDLDGEPVVGVPSAVWLGWWMDRYSDPSDLQTFPQPLPGQRWRLPVVLKRPHGTYNPHGFDAERWFLERGLGASGQVPAAHRARARLLARAVPFWREPEAWRAALRDRIDAHVRDNRVAGLVAGLTIGDQSAVDAQDWSRFRDAGVAHVLAISGLHITLFAALTAPLAAAVWRLWPRACLLVPAPMAGAAVGGCCALGYALVAGWALPAQRTVAMLAVVTVARWASVQWPPVLVWVLAAAPVVLFDPWAVGQASFWLSFAAVGLLLVSAVDPMPVVEPGAGSLQASSGAAALARLSRWGQWVRRTFGSALRQQILAAVGLAPLAALFFHQVSLVGVVANLLAVPWITLVVTPLALLGLAWPPLWSALPHLIDLLNGFLEWLLAWPWAVWWVPAAGPVAAGAAVWGAVLMLAPVPVRVRVAGLLLMLPLALPAPEPVAVGRFQAWGLDVGQGSAVLIRTHGHDLLVDAGPAGLTEGADAGARVVVPALMALGVRRLDLLVVTHRDADHAGGVAAVLDRLPVTRMLGSLEPAHGLRRRTVPWSDCRAGLQWVWDGVRFEVVHPLQDLSGSARARLKPNTVSCVIRVEDAHGRSLLVTADIEAAQEAELLRQRPAGAWSTTALVVPHHGSRTSSTLPFIEAVAPRWALVQAGHRNAYGHPSAEVMNRYAQAGVEVAVSPWCGAWTWRSADEPACWRALAPRHWHDHLPP